MKIFPLKILNVCVFLYVDLHDLGSTSEIDSSTWLIRLAWFYGALHILFLVPSVFVTNPPEMGKGEMKEKEWNLRFIFVLMFKMLGKV